MAMIHMGLLEWFTSLSINYKLGIAVFVFTISAYLVLFILGRKWRNEFEAQGVTYWQAPKEQRLEELMDSVWEPRKITFLYGLSYFTNGFVRTTFSLWVPIFLLDDVGVSTFEASLFVALMYVSWSWKMFIGLVADIFPFRYKGRLYKRKPWFVVTGVLYVVGVMIMLSSDIRTDNVWSVLFPAVVSILTAGAFYDMAADSFAIDVTPPQYHARVIGGASTAGQSVGSAFATLLPLWLLNVGGYKLVFVVAGLTGLTSFLFLSVREPEVKLERAFSREAVAFTFTELTVVMAVLVMFSRAFTPAKITAPLGGCFPSLFVRCWVLISPWLARWVWLLRLRGYRVPCWVVLSLIGLVIRGVFWLLLLLLRVLGFFGLVFVRVRFCGLLWLLCCRVFWRGFGLGRCLR